MTEPQSGKFHWRSLVRKAIDRLEICRRVRAYAAPTAIPEILESRCLLSSTWFVSPSGSDQNPGNLNFPFKSIQAAANLAQPGDHVEIRGGVYDETVTPKYSGTSSDPIVYEAYNNESVTISGAAPLAGWTLGGGNIYEAKLPTNLGEGNNQIFVDGQALNEARFPNSTDLSHPNLDYADSVSIHGHSATVYDSALDQPAGYWVGAVIHIGPGQNWITNTGYISSSSPGEITYTFQSTDSYEYPSKGNGYYLTGTLKALTAPGEFFVSSSGTAYVWTPASDNPNGDDVEVKQRTYAFNLNGLSNITIQNINIIGATITTNGSSASDVLNHLTVSYPSQFLITPQGWQAPGSSGILLNGNYDILENSVVSDSPGNGVFVTGYGSRVTNNLIHDVDTGASDDAGVTIYGSNVEVDHNTIYNTGRDGIKHYGQKLQILYNTLYNIGLQTTEAGGIYCVETNGGGTVIAYNTVSNMHSGGYGGTALFLDNNSSDYVLHDNVVYNVDYGMKLNFVSENDIVYNNTLNAALDSIFSNYKGSWSGSKFTNNVFLKSAKLGSGASSSGNVTTTGVSGKGAAGASSGAGSNVGSGTSGGIAPPTTVIVTPTAPSDPLPPVTTTPPITTAPPVTTAPVIPPPTVTPVDPTPTTPSSVTTPPTVVELAGIVQADRTAVVTATTLRKTTLKQLQTTLKTDQAAYANARRQYAADHRAAARSSAPGQTQSALAQISSELASLLAQVTADKLALKQDVKTDFTGISTAKENLQSAIRVMHAAHRTSK